MRTVISCIHFQWVNGKETQYVPRIMHIVHKVLCFVAVYCGRFNTLRPRQNGRHFADDIFKCIFLNENVSIAIKVSLKFVPKGPINNIPALVQIMAWRRPGDKPLSEPMMVSLPTHICVTRPQWVNSLSPGTYGCNLKLVIFKLKSRTDILSISCEIALRWMPQDLTDE